MGKPDNLKEATVLLTELEKLLTERISDLHNVQGGMQSRHAYIYYRDYVYRIERLLKSVNPK